MTTALQRPKPQAFADLPPPLGEVVAEYRIAAGEAIAAQWMVIMTKTVRLE